MRPPTILLVRKTTNFEWYGSYIQDQVAQGHMPASDLARLRLAHDEHYASLELLRTRLTAAGLSFTEISRETPWPTADRYNLVITVGGDGTLLSSSHNLADDTTIIGVRSSATSVGWLCACDISGIETLVGQIASGSLRVESAARIQTEITRVASGQKQKTLPVLNDLLFCNASPAATTRYRLHVGSQMEGQKSSGIWVATATGSTAAIHAAGGEIVPRHSRQFQYWVREVVRIGSPKYSLLGGLYDPDAINLSIENRNENGMLALDGQHGVIELGLGDWIRIFRGPDLQIVRAVSACNPHG